jgi:dUTP pyrophosphatase
MIDKIRVAKLTEKAILPKRKNSTDAGIDFYSLYDTVIPAGEFEIVGTGITVEIPEGYFMLLKPKGKNNHLVGAGVVDSFYHPGEIMFKIFNTLNKRLLINYGDAIGQGVLIPIETPELVEVSVDDLKNKSNRSGEGGIVKQTYIQSSLVFEN